MFLAVSIQVWDPMSVTSETCKVWHVPGDFLLEP